MPLNYSIYTKILVIASLLFLVPLYVIAGKSKMHLPNAAENPYALWVIYLVYVYLVLTPLLALDENIPSANLTTIRYFTLLIYARVVIQAVLRLWLKKWSPLVGFSYNLFCLFQFSFLYNVYADAFKEEAGNLHSSSLFLSILLSCLVVDSMYALLFYRNNSVDRKLMLALNFLHIAGLFLFLISVFR